MKKFISLLLALSMLFVLCACETSQERAQRRIREATQSYNDAQNKLNDLENELDYVQWQIENAEGK